MSKPNSHDAAIKIHHEICPLIDRLCGRWACEKEYEDFAEYAEVIKKNMPEGGEFVKATKRPFGVVYKAPAVSHQGNTNMLTYRTFVKRNKIELELVK